MSVSPPACDRRLVAAVKFVLLVQELVDLPGERRERARARPVRRDVDVDRRPVELDEVDRPAATRTGSDDQHRAAAEAAGMGLRRDRNAAETARSPPPLRLMLTGCVPTVSEHNTLADRLEPYSCSFLCFTVSVLPRPNACSGCTFVSSVQGFGSAAADADQQQHTRDTKRRHQRQGRGATTNA